MSRGKWNRDYWMLTARVIYGAILLAGSALLSPAPAMSQGNPPVFNNAPTTALPSICSVGTFNFSFALGNVMNHTDGTVDLVMICGQNIVTLEGNGDGTFGTTTKTTTVEPPVITPLPPLPGGPQISHFSLANNIDGGGQLGLVATAFDCNVYVFLGTGTGAFSIPSTPKPINEGITTCNASTAPGIFFVADFNGDGKPDIAVENRLSGPPSIIVLLNTSTPGAVSFGAPNVIPLGIPANSSTQQFGGMAVGNFTGQSVPDLAVAVGIIFSSGAGFTNTVYVLKNNGLGTAFTALTSVALPQTPNTGTLVGLVAGNFSSDGFPDVAAIDSGDSAIFVLDGHGTGVLTSCSPPGSTTTITSCQTTDGQTITGSPLIFANQLFAGNFNGPGGPPGLLFQSANECMSVLLGVPGGGLQTTPTTYVVGNSATSVVTGDVNKDGFTDAIVPSNNGLSVFLNNTGGTLEGTQAFVAGAAPGEIALLQNFFGNGEQDIAVIPINSGITGSAAAVTVFGAPASGPNGTLPQNSGPIPVPPGQSITAMTSGCVLANTNPCTTPFVAYATYESAINTAFGFAFTTSTGGPATDIGSALSSQQITAIAAGDFNRDGNTDLAFAIGNTNTILVFAGNGDGTFSKTPSTISLGAGQNPVALAVADFDGDGKPDIAVLNQSKNTVGILINSFTGSPGAVISFPTMVSYPTGLSFPVGFTVGDFNGDTKPDIAVVSGTAIAILLNQGGGAFPTTAPTPIALPPTAFGTAIATADFNGDGIRDLAVTLSCCSDPDTVEILNGKGDGTFATTAPTFWSVGANPAAMVVANFKGSNGNGLPDIAVADGDPEGDTVALLLNGTAVPPPNTSSYAQYSVNGSPTGGPIDFGEVEVNTTGTQTLTLTNTGNSAFMVNGVSLQGSSSAFSITNVVCNGSTVTLPFNSNSPPVTLAGPGGVCTFNLQFLPTVVQTGYGELLAIATTATNSNATAGPGGIGQALLLAGDGVGPPFATYSNSSVDSPTDVTFGNVGEDIPVIRLVTVTNTGTGPLIIQAASIAPIGKGFSLIGAACNGVTQPNPIPFPITLAPGSPGGSCNFTVQFDPASLGLLSSGLGFADNAGLGQSNLTSTTINATTFQQNIPLSGTGISTSTSTITGTAVNFFVGYALATNQALVGLPVTVNFTVAPNSGSVTPTGSVVVVDGFNDACPAATLSGGKGSCALTVSQLGSGSTPLTAIYSPDSAAILNGLSTSSSSPVTELVAEIVPCGSATSPVTTTSGSVVTISFNICLAGNVTTSPSAVTSGCPPKSTCTVTITPVAGQPGVYTIAVTMATSSPSSGRIVPVHDRRPWGTFRPLTIFAIGMLLAILIALKLARQSRTRLRPLYAAVFLIAVLLSGIFGCSNSSTAGGTGTPAGTYTINVTVTVGAFTTTVPLTLTVTQ
jgi:hypothetical protein